MKFEVTSKRTSFQPFELTISIESKRELEYWWALLNNTGEDILKFVNDGIADSGIKEFEIDIDTYPMWKLLDRELINSECR